MQALEEVKGQSETDQDSSTKGDQRQVFRTLDRAPETGELFQ